MPKWKQISNELFNNIEIVVKERIDSRNHHGATEYIIEAKYNGELIRSERHSWNAWLGHCCGQLLKPLVAERAARNIEA